MFRNLLLRFNRQFGKVLIAIALMGGYATGLALDLPVKTVNNRQFYYYKVAKGDTKYSLANRFGISQAEMEKYNPDIRDGLKSGTTLYFPVDEFGEKSDVNNGTTRYIVKKGDTLFGISGKFNVPSAAIVALNPGADHGLKEGQTLNIPTGESKAHHASSTSNNEVTPIEPSLRLTPVDPPVYPKEDNADSGSLDNDEDFPAEAMENIEIQPLNVVICLPFMLNEKTMSKTAVYATDFYRGFLLGIDSLRHQYGYPALNITTIDSNNPQTPLKELTSNKDKLKDAHIIIAPDATKRLEQLGEFGKQNNVYIFNPFQARESTYMSNPYMMQGNISANDMYDKAIDYFIGNYNGATIVLLDNTNSKKDKQAFVDLLSKRLGEAGIDVKTLKFDGTLTSAALTGKFSNDKRYVFVPMDGSLAEFQKVATALNNFKSNCIEADKGGDVVLFGYPEYTRFTGDALDKLKKLGASIYTRFFNDPTSPKTEAIRLSYQSRYGTTLPDGVPNQALYGYDIARWLIALASQGDATRQNIIDNRNHDGIQTTYHFQPVENGGLVNDVVIIATFSDNEDTKIDIL